MLQTLWGFTPNRAYEEGTRCWNNYKSRSHKWLILPGCWKAWCLWHPRDRNLGLFAGSMPSLSQALHPLLPPIPSLPGIRLLAWAVASLSPGSQGNLASGFAQALKMWHRTPSRTYLINKITNIPWMWDYWSYRILWFSTNRSFIHPSDSRCLVQHVIHGLWLLELA